MLSEKNFNLLKSLAACIGGGITQRSLSESIGYSLGTVNSCIKDCIDAGLVSKNLEILPKGLEALSPYKVDNAIIMAAGMSTRFAPLSYEKPKALLKVKDEILIEREIRQLQEAGIKDITVVVGYLKEKLFYLGEKFGIDIVVNDDYYRYNNTSTLIRVIDKLKNTYICSSDNYFTENVFEPYVYDSYYAAVYATGKTEEYCLSTDTSGLIKKVNIGGENAWYMLGHVYFSKSFSEKFKEILQREYESPVTKTELWENLYMRHIKELPLYIKKYDSDKIKEFDSLDELRDFDSEYLNNVDSQIFKNIKSVLKCEDKDIKDIHPIKTGLTNVSFYFSANGKKYVYRHPGVGTELYINRKSEFESLKIAKELGLEETFLFMDGNKGWKISEYIENAQNLDCNNNEQIKTAIKMLQKLHNSNKITEYIFDPYSQIKNYEKEIKDDGRFTEEMECFSADIKTIRKIIESVPVKKVLCHGDCDPINFIVSPNGKITLLDWEYSGTGNPVFDFAGFIACTDFSVGKTEEFIELYLNKQPTKDEKRCFFGAIATMAYTWFLWSIYQEVQNKNTDGFMHHWYKTLKLYSKKTINYKEDILSETNNEEKKSISSQDKEKVQGLIDEVFEHQEILSIERGGGLTNKTFFVEIPKGKYVVRLPGEGTEELVNRSDELKSTQLACDLGIDAKLYHFNPNTGTKVMDYIPNAITLNAEQLRESDNVKRVAEIFKKLHTSGKDTGVPFDVIDMAEKYEKIITDGKGFFYDDYTETKKLISEIKESYMPNVKKVPCHNDSLCGNWVLSGEKLYLIDWEYSGMNDPMWDLADVSIEAEYGVNEDNLLLETYFARKPTSLEIKAFFINKVLIDYLWSLWGKARAVYEGEWYEQYAFDRWQRMKINKNKLEEIR